MFNRLAKLSGQWQFRRKIWLKSPYIDYGMAKNNLFQVFIAKQVELGEFGVARRKFKKGQIHTRTWAGYMIFSKTETGLIGIRYAAKHADVVLSH